MNNSLGCLVSGRAPAYVRRYRTVSHPTCQELLAHVELLWLWSLDPVGSA